MHTSTFADAILAPTITARSVHELVADHSAAMAAYEARLSAGDDSAPDYTALDAARDALLAHRPATAEEAQVKLAYYVSCRSFTDWDDFDRVDLLESLVTRVAGSPRSRQ